MGETGKRRRGNWRKKKTWAMAGPAKPTRFNADLRRRAERSERLGTTQAMGPRHYGSPRWKMAPVHAIVVSYTGFAPRPALSEVI
jgi:hypothetical protein